MSMSEDRGTAVIFLAAFPMICSVFWLEAVLRVYQAFSQRCLGKNNA